MNTKEALKFAVELEKEGLRTYLDMAKRTRCVDGKDTFIWLAQEELNHMELFERMLKKLGGDQGGDIEGEVSREEKTRERIRALLPKVKKLEVAKGGKASAHELDALRAALKLEAKTRDFYLEQADKVEDPEAAQLFRRLAEVEQGHYDLIQAQIDYATQTGFWFGVMEFDVEAR